MPKLSKITETVSVRGVSHIAADINSINDKHRITPADLTRGLLEAAVAFYREHGFFSFPVRIEPEAFQEKWLAAEAPAQRGYEPSPTAIIEADEAARRYDADQKKAGRKKRGAAPRKPATGGA